MKKTIFLLLLLVETSTLVIGQSTNSDNYGWDKRISFIAGGGASFVLNELYLDPIINKTNNNVIIEKAAKAKPNVTLGIVFTPKVVDMERTIKLKRNDKIIKEKIIEYYPKGFSFCLFANPFSLNNLGSSNVSNTIDLGYGVGYRSGNFSVFLTNEYFAIRQPRKYFIDLYKGNDKPYVINGQMQSAIDVNDNSIFKTAIGITLGIKLCYTFDIVKSYYTNSKQLSEQQKE
jgi:hypothetical protein